jgi:hypothetical protein
MWNGKSSSKEKDRFVEESYKTFLIKATPMILKKKK